MNVARARMVGGQSLHSSPSVDNRNTFPYNVPSPQNLHTFYPPQTYSPYQYYPPQFEQAQQYGVTNNYYYGPYYPPSYYPTPKYHQNTVYYPKPNQPAKHYNANSNPNQTPTDNGSIETTTEMGTPNGQLPRILFPGIFRAVIYERHLFINRQHYYRK
jgi:hypothetical protein